MSLLERVVWIASIESFGHARQAAHQDGAWVCTLHQDGPGSWQGFYWWRELDWGPEITARYMAWRMGVPLD